ncbi:MAG: membrane protein insertase YidC [Clostridia bacterium]|nr:membrane protein insertase YidC [Clostridia bacterium]
MILSNILASLGVINESLLNNVPLEGIDQLVKTLIETFSFGAPIAVGILLFSLLLKIIPLPLDIYSRVANKKNALKMERIRPELEKLQRQYANNKELYAKKMQALYKKEGYSMMASCLPTILTLIFFIMVISSFNRYSTYSNLEIYNNMAKSYNYSIVTNAKVIENYDIKIENDQIISISLKNGKSLSDEEITLIQNTAKDEAAKTYKEEIKKYEFLWIGNIWIGDLPWKKSFISENDIDSLFKYSEGCRTEDVKGNELSNKETFKDLISSSLLEEEKAKPNGYLILVLISIGTMLISQLIATKTQKAQMELQSVDGMNGQAAQTTKMMTWMMPIMFGFFAFMYSSAFSLYLIVSTVFSTISTVIINKITEKNFAKYVQKEEEDKYNKRYGHLIKNKKED